MIPSAPAGLFGKVPAQVEFVRFRAASAAARALVAWLEAGSSAAHRAGRPRPSRAVRFVFAPPATGRALVGAFTMSEDRVGRRFPLALFSEEDATAAAPVASLLPRLARAFLDEVERLLAAAAVLPVAELLSRVEGLSRPVLATGEPDERARAEALAAPVAQAFAGAQHDAAVADQLSYALHCLRSAFALLPAPAQGSAGVALDLPARDEAQRCAWLELACRRLRQPRPPTFAWTEPGGGRLLLAPERPPEVLFLAACDPAYVHGRLWPVATESPAAIAAARRALGAAVCAVLDRPGATVGELLAAMGG